VKQPLTNHKFFSDLNKRFDYKYQTSSGQ